jgi:hypothetical protein
VGLAGRLVECVHNRCLGCSVYTSMFEWKEGFTKHEILFGVVLAGAGALCHSRLCSVPQ